MTDQIGFIGLGQMGLGMANNLQQAQGSVLAFDASEEAIASARGDGLETATSLNAIAQTCSTVVLCLPSAREVNLVLNGEVGLLQQAGAETRALQTILDASTLLRQEACGFSSDCAKQDIDYLDCPVSGLPARAKNGTLTIMVGAAKDSFARNQELLQSMGSDVLHCGENGSGQAMKAVNNVIYNINIAAMCEVVPLAVASGLEIDAIKKVIFNGSSRSFASAHFLPRILEREFGGDFPMQSAYKDIQNIQQLAAEATADPDNAFSAEIMSTTQGMMDLYQQALDQGLGAESKSGWIKIIEQALGLQLRADAPISPDSLRLR